MSSKCDSSAAQLGPGTPQSATSKTFNPGIDKECSGEHVHSHDLGWISTSDYVERHWRPSVIQFRPLSGLLALGIAASCMLASLGVLVASDKQPTQSWTTQPTVPLAISSAVGAGAIRYAKCCAAPISWWHGATEGRTVRQLEHHWRANRGILTALTSLRFAPWVSVATLLTAL